MDKTQEHREWVIRALTSQCTDLKYIKEQVDKNEKHLSKINNRVGNTEKKISFLQGIGSFIGILFGAFITFLFKKG